MQNGSLDLEKLLRVPYVEPDLGFDISPDSSRAAFSWNKTGRWEIYVLDLGGDSPPQQISTGEGAKFAPRWRPDGAQLAYALDLDGGENYDIYIYDMAAGSHTNITPDTPEALTSSFAWSPDGEQMAFCSDKAGRFDTYIMPSTGGSPRKVLDAPHPDWQVTWSPDGRHLAVISEGAGQDYWITIVPAGGSEPFPIAIGGKPICAKDACWSPDGKRLAFASNLSGQFEIGLFEIETQTIIWVTSGDGEKEHPDWISGGQLVYVISRGPKCELAFQNLDEKTPATFQVESGVVYRPRVAPQRDQILFIFDNPRHPCDLWSFSLTEKSFRQITHSLPAEFDQEKFFLPQEVWYPGLDGVDVPALLYNLPKACPERSEGSKPAGGLTRPPAVLYIHGGPNWLTQITWDPLVQHIVSRGWVMLAPNYRGSTGYGKEWQLASRFDLGGVDTQDVVAGADYLIREEIADPERIAVTGRSWGGYLTMTCLTQYPDKWAAGSAVVPFLNWFTSYENSRQDLQHWDRENFGDPLTNHKLWYERSPFFFLDRIQAPVQLICGAHDVRCPPSESQQAYEKLISLGKECEYSLYPDEGHSFLKIENQIKVKQQRANFLAKYLE
ncbi:MAG: S9 family peptidase [Chloroflexi bacterium]|nr:S9 family peptidase [Chloroflexota bacterium]